MTTSNIFNDISSIYLEEVFKPQLGKSDEAPKKAGAPAGGPQQSGEEGSAKRVRQAVYDIRYRARREDVPLEQAFNQYMSNTSMNAVEKKEVKEKLGIGPGGKASAPVKEENEVNESEDQKYQVRVTDKLTGKSYVRMATREKINQLRANKNIASVEMTKYGSPYEGEKKKGKQTASVTSGKGLDPVGKEDSDVDNDGKKNDSNDRYIMKRRKAIGNAMNKRKTVSSSYEMNGDMIEGFSNWREDIREVVSDDIAFQKKNQIKDKKVNNYEGKDKCINLSPKIEEAVEEIGGHLIESVELDEQFIAESVQTASEYFFNEGLNEYGVDLLIEDLGLDAFVEFVFELSGDSVLSEKVETRLQKKAGKALKGPKGSKVQSSTNAALKKHGLTRKIDGDAPSSTIKKNRKAEPKPEVKASVEKAKESQPKKRPVLDAIARQVNAGVKRHQAAMSAARETGKTIGKAASGAGKVAKEFGKGVSGATKLAARLVRGEEFEHVLDELTNAELYFLSNGLIEEVVEEVFFECIEEGYEVDEIEEILTESLDISLESFLVEGDRYDSAVATSKKNAKLVAKNKTVQRRAERTQKVKDTVKGVADKIRSAGKKAVYGAGYAAGKAVSAAKKAGEAAASAGKKAGEAAASAGSKAKEVAKKVSDTAKAGYAAGKGGDDSDSDDSKSSGSYRIKYKTASGKKSKEPGMLSKIGSTLKSGLKKAIGKSARAVSRGARNVARRMDEEVELQEKITAKTDMGDAIKDFYGSDSPQLAGRTKEERRKAAIAAVLTARRGGKKLGEAITQMSGRETTPPEGTTAKQDDIMRKQMINNRQKMLMKQQMLQKQKLAQQKKGAYPMEQMDQQQTDQQQNNADDKKAEMLRKQQIANRQKMIQKKQMLQRQELALQKQGKLPMETEEFVSELNRYEKETGKDYKTGKPSVKGGTAKNDKAFQMVSKMMGSGRMGVQPRGQKKVPGKKPPKAGEYGGPVSPAQKVAKRRADAQRARDNMSSRFD